MNPAGRAPSSLMMRTLTKLLVVFALACRTATPAVAHGPGLRHRLSIGEKSFEEVCAALVTGGYMDHIPRDPGYSASILQHYVASELSEDGFLCVAHGPVSWRPETPYAAMRRQGSSTSAQLVAARPKLRSWPGQLGHAGSILDVWSMILRHRCPPGPCSLRAAHAALGGLALFWLAAVGFVLRKNAKLGNCFCRGPLRGLLVLSLVGALAAHVVVIFSQYEIKENECHRIQRNLSSATAMHDC